METNDAVAAMSALAHAYRMEIFRLLVKVGPAGRPAGEISATLDMSPSTFSFHISQLERADLVRSHRVSRQIFYSVDVEGMRDLLRFLTEDCCDGQPELCGDLAGPTGHDLSPVAASTGRGKRIGAR